MAQATIPRERIPDQVMLDDFARLLEIGRSGEEIHAMSHLLELCRFMDDHGDRLLVLARTCKDALQRQAGGMARPVPPDAGTERVDLSGKSFRVGGGQR